MKAFNTKRKLIDKKLNLLVTCGLNQLHNKKKERTFVHSLIATAALGYIHVQIHVAGIQGNKEFSVYH